MCVLNLTEDRRIESSNKMLYNTDVCLQHLKDILGNWYLFTGSYVVTMLCKQWRACKTAMDGLHHACGNECFT